MLTRLSLQILWPSGDDVTLGMFVSFIHLGDCVDQKSLTDPVILIARPWWHDVLNDTLLSVSLLQCQLIGTKTKCCNLVWRKTWSWDNELYVNVRLCLWQRPTVTWLTDIWTVLNVKATCVCWVIERLMVMFSWTLWTKPLQMALHFTPKFVTAWHHGGATWSVPNPGWFLCKTPNSAFSEDVIAAGLCPVTCVPVVRSLWLADQKLIEAMCAMCGKLRGNLRQEWPARV